MLGISYKESLEWIKKEQQFLDTKDLKPFFIKDKSIYDIMEEIEDSFGKEYKLEEYIFNNMGHHEFIDYLLNRYTDIKFYTYEDIRVR